MVSRWYALLLAALILVPLASGCQTIVQAAGDAPLTASGTIRAAEVRVAAESGGRILEVRAQPGEPVAVGNVLVVLDATPWLIQLSVAEAAVATARADLAVILAGPRAEEIDAARAMLAVAEAERDLALERWQDALAEVEDPREIQAQIIQARTQVALAAQGTELAEASLAREQLVRDQTPAGSVERRVADMQVLAAEAALAAAQADERTAQTLLSRLVAIRDEPLGFIAQANAAEGAYRVAEQAAAVARAQLDDLLAGPTPQETAVAEAMVRQAEAEADVLRVQVEQCTITSPIDGVVMSQALRVGEIAPPAATILTLADLDEVILAVYVPENRIGQVYLGQAVQVTVDSFPGVAFDGWVTRIGDEPEFTPRNVATAEERLNTFYAVEIQLPNPAGLLKPGMPADAAF
ncbi:MAG: efflux RND transporter periplasmic adaptor subunit [Anaerolineae bacterium]|nr:efflux RND transporter periplasmic adaptor subunit [Anaerolineae bacterium]